MKTAVAEKEKLEKPGRKEAPRATEPFEFKLSHIVSVRHWPRGCEELVRAYIGDERFRPPLKVLR